MKADIQPSFFLKKIIWGVSLYLECGNFKENWRTYSRASDEAKRVRASGDKDWRKQVTFEHARPLANIYQMLRDEGALLTLEQAVYIIGEYPPVLITRKEEQGMAGRGFKSKGTPEERYSEIQISEFTLRSENRGMGTAV